MSSTCVVRFLFYKVAFFVHSESGRSQGANAPQSSIEWIFTGKKLALLGRGPALFN